MTGPSGAPALERPVRPWDDPLFDRLFPPLPTGVHWGLERTAGALEALGDPHLACPVVHVGGTNGKGSVASTVAAVLDEAGVRTALYTSPHLCSFRERFVVGGRPLPAEVLVARADEIRDVVVRFGLTFFEAATVLGFHAFAAEGVEAAVVEVGLGGRLDATNVVRPAVTAVTNVALDHADFLGATLPEIAREKAGIVKTGVPFVTAEAEGALAALLEATCRERGAPFLRLDPATELGDVEVARDSTSFTLETGRWGRLRLTTPLVGRHQAANAALAVRVLEHLPAGLRPGTDAVVAGVAAVRWPGRDQIETVDGRTWLFDVAHNTAGIASLVEVLDRVELPAPRVALIGVLGDKDWRAMLPPLLTRTARAVLTQPPSAPAERRWDPSAAAEAVGAGGAGGTLETVEDFAAALGRARALAGDGTVVVTGSCHTVGDALRLLERCPFGD